MARILIIDDDTSLTRSLQLQLKQKGHNTETAHTGADGLKILHGFNPELVLLDVTLPDTNGLDILRSIREARPQTAVIMITGRQDMHLVIDAMKHGAFDYIRKPFDIEDIFLLVEKSRLKQTRAVIPTESLEEMQSVHAIIGTSAAILQVVKQIGLLARDPVPVVIIGESGTGKELVARALHEAANPTQPFVAVNCAAMVSSLLASELFGHERGAFTGAAVRHIGKLELAAGGTFFLDEIGEIPPDFQSKLLRVLQEREFERVGGNQKIPFHARIVAATHRDLAAMVREGQFREDLYYRLSVGEIRIPPLRDRKEDIPILANYFLTRYSRTTGRTVRGLDRKALELLLTYDFPGNVRELENILARAIVMARDDVLSRDDVAAALRPMAAPPSAVKPLWQVEKDAIAAALAATEWNISRTARELEISPTTLRKKIRDYGLESGRS